MDGGEESHLLGTWPPAMTDGQRSTAHSVPMPTVHLTPHASSLLPRIPQQLSCRHVINSYYPTVPSGHCVRFAHALTRSRQVAGNTAGLEAWYMNMIVCLYVLLRIVFVVLYINTTTKKWSLLRSVTWIACNACWIVTVFRAGHAFNLARKVVAI